MYKRSKDFFSFGFDLFMKQKKYNFWPFLKSLLIWIKMFFKTQIDTGRTGTMPRGSSWSWTYSRSGGNFTGEFLLLNFPINLEIWNATPKPTFESRRWVSRFDTIFLSISLSSFKAFSGEDISFDIFSLNAFHADILGLLERPKIFGWRLILFLKFKSSNFNLVVEFYFADSFSFTCLRGFQW